MEDTWKILFWAIFQKTLETDRVADLSWNVLSKVADDGVASALSPSPSIVPQNPDQVYH